MVRTDFARRGVPWVALLLGARLAPAVDGVEPRLAAPRQRGRLRPGVAGLLLRRSAAALAALLVLLGANRDFYVLLPPPRVAGAVAGVGLHAVHHLTALAAVPAGVAVHLRDRRPVISKSGAEAAPVRLRPEPTSAVPDVAIMTSVGRLRRHRAERS